MRIPSFSGVLIFAAFATAGLGFPLAEGGKLSISNMIPVVFVAFSGTLFLVEKKRIDKEQLLFLLVFNITCALSFAIFLVRFGWTPNFLVLFFQDVELVFCMLLMLYARENWHEFKAAVRGGIYVAAVLAALFGWYNFGQGGLLFGMDDKSQAAVFLCCAAYILVRYFRGTTDCLLGLGLLVASFLTISRLPVVFVPAIFCAVMGRSWFGVVFAAALVCGVAGVMIAYGDAVTKTFVVFERLSSVDEVSGSDSTSAHFALLQAAAQIKFSDPLAFFFGTGPGNFSKALMSFMPPEAATLAMLDPALVAEAQVGRAPMHSMPMQLLLDYNIVIFLLFVYGACRAAMYLLRSGGAIDLLFFGGLFVASTFYSVHNKPYFFLLTTTIALLMMKHIETSRLSRQVSPSSSQRGNVDSAPPLRA